MPKLEMIKKEKKYQNTEFTVESNFNKFETP